MKLGIGYLLFLIILLTYGYYQQQRHIENVQIKAEARQVDPRIKARENERSKQITNVSNFFTKYKSSLKNYADVFVDAQYIWGIDYRLLPSITMVESTGAKFTPSCAQYNPFGFTSTSSPCGFYRFQNYREAIEFVANKIGNGNAYVRYQQTKRIEALAANYSPVSKDWQFKVEYFMNEIEKK